MKLYLLRHGQVEFSEKHNEKILTKIGKKQVQYSAKKLSQIKFDTIYSSTLIRTKQSSKIVSKYHNNNIKYDDLFKELHKKVIGGIHNIIDETRFKKDSIRAKESWQLVSNLKKNKVLIVCHGNLIRYYICKLLNISAKKGNHFNIYEGSITILDTKNNSIEIINDISHIPKKLVGDVYFY